MKVTAAAAAAVRRIETERRRDDGGDGGCGCERTNERGATKGRYDGMGEGSEALTTYSHSAAGIHQMIEPPLRNLLAPLSPHRGDQ